MAACTRAQWLLHHRYLRCLPCCALQLLLQDKMLLLSPAGEGEHLKAISHNQKQSSYASQQAHANVQAATCAAHHFICQTSFDPAATPLNCPQSTERTAWHCHQPKYPPLRQDWPHAPC